MRRVLSLLISVFGLALAPHVSAAIWTVTSEGVTYELTGTAVDGDTWNYILKIIGANTASDTEKGRTLLQDLAFGRPTGFVSTTPTSRAGGLNANGCNGSGNFFCFDNINLVASSLMTFGFSVDATGLATWTPHIKVDWAGSKNNYNNVSLNMTPVPPCTNGNCEGLEVPEPGSLALLGAGLAGLALIRRRRLT